MTVENTRGSTEPAATNGITREWGFDFYIDSKPHANLILLDELGNESEPIDPDLWDFSGDGVGSGFITYPRAPLAVLPATGAGSGRIRIDRAPSFKQETNLISQGAYRAGDVERALDKVVWQVQALNEEKDRLKARILAVIAGIEALDITGLGDLQTLVDQALEAATSATSSAAEAEEAQQAAEGIADGIGADVQSVEDNAILVEQMVNGLPGTEYAPGRTSALDILTRMEALLALAPVTQVVTVGDHAGEDEADQVFTATLAWKGAVVVVNRAAASACTLKFPAGLHLKAPDAGYDASVSISRVINNCGAGGTVILEGPADPGGSGDIVTKPTQIFQKTQVDKDTLDTSAARTINVTGTIPAGPNRRVAIYAFVEHVTTPSSPTMTCAQFTNITVRDTDGIGLYNGSDPILGRVWTAEMSGSAQVSMTAAFAIAANMASAVLRVVVYKDASAVEGYDVFCRTAAGTSETYVHTPTQAGAAIDMIAAHQGAGALTGMTVGAGEDLLVGKTPGLSGLRDMSYATNVDLDVAASAQTKTGASDKNGPGAIAGMCFLPVTTTGGGGGDDQLYGVGSKTLARYEQADVLAHSSGTIAFYSRS